MRLWRIVKSKHAASAFSGDGARLYGGRWNEPGTPLVYLSESLSLAALELFVHLEASDAILQFVAIPVDYPEGTGIDVLTDDQLPSNWRTEPAPKETKRIGSAWARNGTALFLSVPSIIVPEERNMLLNPTNGDTKNLTIGAPRPFGFDGRMWK